MNEDLFQRQLRQQLESAAEDVRLRPGSAHAVARAGRRGHHRRRRAATAAAAIVVVGTGGIAVVQLTRPSQRVETEAPATTLGQSPAAELALARVEPTMVWRRVDPSAAAAVGLSTSAMYQAASPPLPGFMVSSAPAPASSPNWMLWRSADGISWSEVGLLPNGATAAASWTGGGRVYAVGTAPAAAGAEPGVQVSVSGDDGVTWNGMEVPIANAVLSALPGVTGVGTAVTGIAGTDRAVLVAIRQVASVDVRGLLREAGFVDVIPELDDPAAEILVTADGVLVQTADAAEGRSVPWEALRAVERSLLGSIVATPRLFASADGGPFAEVALPPGAGELLHARVGVELQLAPVGDEIVLSMSVYGSTGEVLGPRYWRTADGLTWAEITPPPVTGGIVGSLRGPRLVTVGNGGDGAIVATLADDGTWTRAVLDQLYAADETVAMNTSGAATSPLGLTVAVAISQRVARVQVDDQVSIETTAMDGDAVATTVSGPETTFVVVGFEILHSVDGVSWSRESVAELAGVAAADISAVTRVQAAGDTVVVALNLNAERDEVPRQIVLVGTPKG